MNSYSSSQQTDNFRMGAVISRAFDIYFKEFVLFLVLAIIANIPSVFGIFLQTGTGSVLEVFISILSALLGFAIQGAGAYAAYYCLIGRKIDLGESLSRGFSRLFPILWTCLLVGFAIALSALILLIPLILLTSSNSSSESSILHFFLMIPAIIVALIFYTRWVAIVPICAVEKLSGGKCLKRSSFLTAGNRWKVFGLLIIMFLISGGLGAVFGFIGGLIGGVIFQVMLVCANIVGTSVQIAFIASIYFYLLEAKEGVTLDKLAGIFD